MYSIFHFFKSIVAHKVDFISIKKLEYFPFDIDLLSCKNTGQFPDLAIKINPSNSLFTGGELIELKDSDSYTVSSFNSTIPSGKKLINKIIKGEKSIIKQQMLQAGDNIDSLPMRDVFYLVRGRKKGDIKVALIHGSFFETVTSSDLISQSFSQVLEERLKESNLSVGTDIKELLITMFSEQENFSKVRNIDKASVKLRFRIMTEAKAEGNILNRTKYPEIKDNTFNFLLPIHSQNDEELVMKKMLTVYSKNELNIFNIFKLKHHFNGYFLVFQIDLI